MERTIQGDLSWGEAQEDIIKPKIESFFDVGFEKTSKNNEFDYINKDKKIIIELKSRTNKKDKYPTTIIGNNKWCKAQKLLEQGWEIFFFFNFTDVLCYYEFKNQADIVKSKGGRTDRGRPEIKYYRYIPVSDLVEL